MTDRQGEQDELNPQDRDRLTDEMLQDWQRCLVVPPGMVQVFDPHNARHLHPCQDEAPLPEDTGLMIDPGDGGGTGLE